MSILTFDEKYVPRMWGGDALRRLYEKDTPQEAIGEAWLVSDHPFHTSIINRGPHAGQSFHNLLSENTEGILGHAVPLTTHGRFPLLLKLLDAQRDLSIQVHPDDTLAAQLGEVDNGKNEMWHILSAKTDSVLYCGLSEALDRSAIEDAINHDAIAEHLNVLSATPGQSIFVPTGTIHSIGAGCMLAEIQQNSDLTYRIDDWGRVQSDGTPRELHREKAFQAIHSPNAHPGATPTHHYLGPDENTTIHVLAACKQFAAEELLLNGIYRGSDRGDTFHLYLGKTGITTLSTTEDSIELAPGQAALIPAQAQGIELEGTGTLLHYYVPDITRNIVSPLRTAGYSDDDIDSLIHL